MTYRSKIYKIAAVWLYSRLPATFYLWFTHRYKTTPINYWLIVINNWTWRCVSRTLRNKKQLKDMESKFKVGDRVRMKRTVCFDYITFEKGCVGEVVSDETDKGTCFVQMKNAENGTVINHFISTSNLEPIDSKTAFLSDLAAVLRKHNAVINVGWNNYFDTDKSPRIDIDIMFKDGNEGICFEDVLDKSLTAENIMNLNKK